MRKIIHSTLVISILLMTFPLTILAQDEVGVSQYLEKTLSEMVQQKQVKGAILSVISQTNEVCKGYGFADEEKGIVAHEEDTAFRIGSISKTFVAVASQQLTQQGKLDMDAPVSVYLEADFPKFKYDMTMNHLLTHTAGFEDLLSGIAVYDIKKAEPLAFSVRKYIPDQVFVPGEVISYSNYGIALAAYVVECITGEDFYEYAGNYIFKPLGMTKTSFELDYKGVKISKAYATSGKEAYEPLINLYPEGSVVSTAADMSKYIQWLMGERSDVLSMEARLKLFEQHFTMSDEFEGIGYIWNRKERNGVLYYDKKGETGNFFSRIVIYPKQKTGVFIAFNTYVEEKKQNGIMDEITNLILGHEKEGSKYVGGHTKDISGYYITTRSNFKSQEKIINFLIPNRVIHITGNLNKGFFMRGKALVPLGENFYATPIGGLKYVEKDGGIYLANNTAISYKRTNWYESSEVQMVIVITFIIFSLIMAVLGSINLLYKRIKGRGIFLASLSILQGVLLIGMCILLSRGIIHFTMLEAEPVIRIMGILITGTSASGILYTLYLGIEKIFLIKHIALVVWNASSLLFCLWMIQVNIL